VGENLILGTNDTVLNDIGKQYGKSVQAIGIRLLQQLQPVVQADAYRRVLRSFVNSVTSTTAESSWTLDFVTGKDESRRWKLLCFGDTTGSDLAIVGTLQRASSGQLKQIVLRGAVDASDFAIILGAGERFAIGGPTGLSQFYPDEIFQPPECTLTFKITKVGGGAFSAGDIELAGSYFIVPPLRSWEAGPPDSTTFV